MLHPMPSYGSNFSKKFVAHSEHLIRIFSTLLLILSLLQLVWWRTNIISEAAYLWAYHFSPFRLFTVTYWLAAVSLCALIIQSWLPRSRLIKAVLSTQWVTLLYALLERGFGIYSKGQISIELEIVLAAYLLFLPYLLFKMTSRGSTIPRDQQHRRGFQAWQFVCLAGGLLNIGVNVYAANTVGRFMKDSFLVKETGSCISAKGGRFLIPRGAIVKAYDQTGKFWTGIDAHLMNDYQTDESPHLIPVAFNSVEWFEHDRKDAKNAQSCVETEKESVILNTQALCCRRRKTNSRQDLWTTCTQNKESGSTTVSFNTSVFPEVREVEESVAYFTDPKRCRSDISSVIVKENAKPDPGEPAGQARVVPYFKSGSQIGFQFYLIEKGSFLEKLGLKNGDIIQRWNGAEISNSARALELASKLKTEEYIDIVRDGEKKQIRGR